MNTFYKNEVQTVIFKCWTGLVQKQIGTVTNRLENIQLFSEGSLPWTDPDLIVKDYAEAPMTNEFKVPKAS
jgi:hypothetical protein